MIPDAWLKYVGIITLALGLLGGAARLVLSHLREDFIRDERLRVLEAVTLSEHPEYTLMIFP
jgi:hypothetical protein